MTKAITYADLCENVEMTPQQHKVWLKLVAAYKAVAAANIRCIINDDTMVGVNGAVVIDTRDGEGRAGWRRNRKTNEVDWNDAMFNCEEITVESSYNSVNVILVCKSD